MRTKTLVCLIAFVGGVLNGIAQSNPVACLSIPIPAHQYVLIANPLNTTNNTISNLLGNATDGAVFMQILTNGVYTAFTYDMIIPGWTPNGDATLNPGECGFYKSPIATTVTFVGEILQGRLTNALPIGQYVMRSSMVPQAGTPTALGIPAEPGDILQLSPGGYSAYVFDGLRQAWFPNEPTIGVGQPFWYRKSPSAKTNLWIIESRSVIRVMNVGLELNGGHLGFDVSGPPGLLFVIQTSTKLLSWVALQTNASPTGYYHFTDPTAATLPARFYRLQAP